MRELSVRGGTVVDGTGRPAYRADVGIADGRIVDIGDRIAARVEIDGPPGDARVHRHPHPL
jgi:N-acyl-D-amino-acid deacylase